MDSNMKKLCSKCGSELDVSHAFCGVCGQKVVMDGEGTSDDSFQYNTNNEAFPLALPVGSILAGQYTIDKVLGQGGFGITYRATDYKTNDKVAIKEFFPDTLAYRENTAVTSYPGERTENYEYGKETFLQEAQTLAQFIGCENIVRIHSYFEENGTAYFVMDYIEGKSFDNYIKEKGGKISYEEAKNILVPVMDALNIVHSKGIVHRDVTPDNIYITNDGVVKLLDFGAARYSLGDKSRSLDVILKHGFAPKEQYTSRGKQGPYTDIYSLGASFYFALTGKRPPDSIERLEDDNLVPPSTLGVAITAYQEDAILKAISVQPADRYSSMLDFKNALLAEPGAKPQPMPTSNVVQHYFTAPMQQTANIENINMSQNQTANEALPQQTVASKKKIKKPIIIAIASVAAVLVVLSIIIAIAIAVPTMLKSTTSGGSSGSNGILDIFDNKKDYTIIGNSSSNLANYAFMTDDGLYYVDNYRRTLCNCKGEELVSSDNVIYNLMKDGNDLYYVSGGSAYIYSESKQGIIEGLSKYNGHISDLFISKDYYFINYRDYSNSKYCLYRVSRKDNKEEQMIEIDTYRITFWGENIYYVDYQTKELVMISAADFNDVKNIRSLNSSTLYYSELVADGQYIYIIVENNKGSDVVMEKITADLNEVVRQYDITNICIQKTGSTNCNISGFVVVGNQMAIAIEGDSDDVGIYHFIENGNELTVDSRVMISQGYKTGGIINGFKSDSSYFFAHCGTDGNIGFGQYDANGKVVE